MGPLYDALYDASKASKLRKSKLKAKATIRNPFNDATPSTLVMSPLVMAVLLVDALPETPQPYNNL